jgi:hypothetical protein
MATSMATTRQQIQRYLQAFDFKHLFVEVLGWDNLREAPLAIACESHTYTLRPLVEKRGVKVYVCDPDEQGKIPSEALLRRIEREVTRSAYEHIIIYVDAARADNRLCQVQEQAEPQEPQIICSLGLFDDGM